LLNHLQFRGLKRFEEVEEKVEDKIYGKQKL